MAVGLPDIPQLSPVAGIRLGTAAAGIRKPGRPDLLVMELPPGATVATAFTSNRFCAAPVQIARRHLKVHSPRYCLINSGNANAGTGTAGYEAGLATCAGLAALVDCEQETVIPFSTGVIGEPLPVNRVLSALPQALSTLSEDGWLAAARAIMTTDTVPKGCSVEYQVRGKTLMLTGIVKGAGMIRPDMATMLAFIATDAMIPKPVLQQCLDKAIRTTLNRISIDGDTSTNDACLLIATAASKTVIDAGRPDDLAAFQAALLEICTYLAQAVVRDGEGATRFVTITVENGIDEAECCRIAYAIAESPLVKTALYAGDPNWGRILAAVGRSGPPDMDIERISIYLNDVCLVENGGLAGNYSEESAYAVMAQAEYTILVELGRGDATSTVWTCDLSYDYVRINAEYRT
jgi:glutamate N-acetyltransferase / amino-acid N-acetyltransferase